MPATYEPIATTTLGSAGNLTFTSIPSTYTDLILVGAGTATSTGDIRVRFNNDSGSNYSNTVLLGEASTARSARSTSATASIIGFYWFGLQSDQAHWIINIQNYANTTTYKTALARSNNKPKETDAIVALWRSTAAIDRIDLFVNGSTFASGTTFSLYGIKAA